MNEFEKRFREHVCFLPATAKILQEAEKEFPFHLPIEHDESMLEYFKRYKQTAIEWFVKWLKDSK